MKPQEDRSMSVPEPPVIRLTASELWQFRKDPLDWLRNQRDTLIRVCTAEAYRAVRVRVPSPEQAAKGEPDRWDEMDEAAREQLYRSIFERVVEKSGGTPEFVHKLLPRSVKDYVIDALAERRAALGLLVATDAAALRERVTREARRVLRAFAEKVPPERWSRLPRSEQEPRLAKLLDLVAQRLELSLAETTDALEASMDVLLHQEHQRMQTVVDPEAPRS
jgi:hypothetical protein